MGLPKGLKVLIFDFDGTLFHLEVDWQMMKQELASSDSLISIGDLIQQFVTQDNPALQKVTDLELASVRDAKLDKAIVNTLVRLSRSFKLAIFTRNSRYVVEKTIEKTALQGKIYIIGREDVRHLKPHTEGLEIILKHFSCRPNNALLIGDTYHDVEAAQSLSIGSVIVANPRLEYAPKGADFYIGGITDLLTDSF